MYIDILNNNNNNYQIIWEIGFKKTENHFFDFSFLFMSLTFDEHHFVWTRCLAKNKWMNIVLGMRND